MANDSFFDETSSLLTSWAFEWVLEAELKRATRAQEFLTLLVLKTSREWGDIEVSVDHHTVEQVARVVRNEVRDSDVLGHVDQGVLALLLSGTDSRTSFTVVERLLQCMDNYAFPEPLRVSLGVACCPTEGADVGVLKQRALSNPVVSWCTGSRHRH